MPEAGNGLARLRKGKAPADSIGVGSGCVGGWREVETAWLMASVLLYSLEAYKMIKILQKKTLEYHFNKEG